MSRVAAAAAAVLAAGCAQDPAGDPAPPQVIEVRVPALTLAPGAEIEGSYPAELDNEPLWIGEIDWWSSPGLHHGRLDAPPRSDLTYYPIFSLSPGVSAGSYTFPDGYALRLPANARLHVAYHWINTGEAAFDGEVVVTLRAAPRRAEPPRPVSMLVLIIDDFTIPAVSDYEASGRCALPEDLELLTTLSHTHALGIGVDASVEGGAHDGESLYASDSWDDPAWRQFDTPLRLARGDVIRWTCRWRNPGARPVPEGSLAEQEMCAIGAYITPADTPLLGAVPVPDGPCSFYQLSDL